MGQFFSRGVCQKKFWTPSLIQHLCFHIWYFVYKQIQMQLDRRVQWVFVQRLHNRFFSTARPAPGSNLRHMSSQTNLKEGPNKKKYSFLIVIFYQRTKNISWRGKTFSFLLRYLYFPVFVVRMRRNTINHKGNILFAFPFSRPPEHLRNILFYIFHNNAFSSSLENHRKYSGFKNWEILSG